MNDYDSTAACRCCGLLVAVALGVVAAHWPTRTTTRDCPGTGLPPRTPEPSPANPQEKTHA